MRKTDRFTASHERVDAQKLSRVFAVCVCVMYMSCSACAKTLLSFCVYEQRLCRVFAVYVIAMRVNRSENAKNQSIYCITSVCMCAKAESCLRSICVYIVYELQSTTRFICTRCWLWIFCKLCLSEELNNLININRAVTALYSCDELTHSRKAKQWQPDHQRVEARTYTEWQQRLCARAATNIRHSHSHCEGTTQLLHIYTSVQRSKSIDFDFQTDLHTAQSLIEW